MADTPKVLTASCKVTLGEDITEKGIMICIKPGDGEAYEAADTATYLVLGINDEVGSEGDDIVVRSGIFRFDNSGDIAQDDIGKPCYVEDSTTVVLADPGNGIFAGAITEVDSNGVWVDCTPAALAGCRSRLAIAAVVALTDNSGGVDPGDDTIAVVTLPAVITDSSTGVDPANNTIAAITEAATITDNSGGADPGDDIIAVITNMQALTDNSGGTANTTIADITEAQNAGSADRVPVENAIATIAVELATQRTANTAITAAVAQLAAKTNVNSLAIDSSADAIAQLAAKANVIRTAQVAQDAAIAQLAAKINEMVAIVN